MMPGANIEYITQGKPDMWRASKLEGVDIYNQNNERIGEIDDVLVDKSGKVEAVVIGVGGFLGIGERNVAVPFNALQWQMEAPRTATTTTTTTTTAPAAPLPHQRPLARSRTVPLTRRPPAPCPKRRSVPSWQTPPRTS